MRYMLKRSKYHDIRSFLNNGIFILLAVLILGAIYVIKIRGINEFSKPISVLNSVKIQNNRSVYIGFWNQGFWDSKTKSINPESLKSLQNQIGKKVAIANYFQGWQYLSNEQIVNDLNVVNNNGWRPMISANPYFFTGCQVNGMSLYTVIANGNCDIFLHKIGKTLSKVKKPFFLRFAWEMNVNSMEWSILYTKSLPQDFINAWRRFHDIVKEEGAKNVIWVFSPQIETPSTTDIALLYPGDKYVDWVGLDGYNWGTSKSWSSWQDFHTIFYNSYIKLAEIVPNKPIMIAEINTTNIGGDQASWYQSMLSNEIPNNFPKVDAIVFFNEDKTYTEGVKWLIDNTPASLEQFKTSISNPIYKSNF